MTFLDAYGKDTLKELILNGLVEKFEENSEIYSGVERMFWGFCGKLYDLDKKVLSYEDPEVKDTFNELLDELLKEEKVEKVTVHFRTGPTLHDAYRLASKKK